MLPVPPVRVQVRTDKKCYTSQVKLGKIGVKSVMLQLLYIREMVFVLCSDKDNWW